MYLGERTVELLEEPGAGIVRVSVVAAVGP
jgi:hypothetical protein